MESWCLISIWWFVRRGCRRQVLGCCCELNVRRKERESGEGESSLCVKGQVIDKNKADL